MDVFMHDILLMPVLHNKHFILYLQSHDLSVIFVHNEHRGVFIKGPCRQRKPLQDFGRFGEFVPTERHVPFSYQRVVKHQAEEGKNTYSLL